MKRAGRAAGGLLYRSEEKWVFLRFLREKMGRHEVKFREPPFGGGKSHLGSFCGVFEWDFGG